MKVRDMPSMIAMCTQPGGPHEHIGIEHIADAATCFADCDCKPKVYVELVDDATGRVAQRAVPRR